jgi:hypothetical protein
LVTKKKHPVHCVAPAGSDESTKQKKLDRTWLDPQKKAKRSSVDYGYTEIAVKEDTM